MAAPNILGESSHYSLQKAKFMELQIPQQERVEYLLTQGGYI